MDDDSDKVILTKAQIPAFLNTVKEAIRMQRVMDGTVGEASAFVFGVNVSMIALEQTLARAAQGPSPDEGLSGDGEQQRPS